MNYPSYNPAEDDNILAQVYEGMTVYDPEGHKIGTVNHVRFGDATAEADEIGVGPATTADMERSETSLLEGFAKSVAPKDPVPEELRQRLLRRGFIRIDCTGMFASDRYAMSDQIARISDGQVILGVSREVLLKH